MSEKIEELRTELFDLRIESVDVSGKIDKTKALLEKEYIDQTTTEILKAVANMEDGKRRDTVNSTISELVSNIKSLNLKIY
jgi:hypothetical protein